MRVLRIARVLKLLKMAKGIRSLLNTVMQALPQVGNLGKKVNSYLLRNDHISRPALLSPVLYFLCPGGWDVWRSQLWWTVSMSGSGWACSLQNIWDGFPYTLQNSYWYLSPKSLFVIWQYTILLQGTIGMASWRILWEMNVMIAMTA